MSYSRWAKTWPGGDPSWYIFDHVDGYLAIWPPGDCPSLNVDGVKHLYGILGSYLEDQGVEVSLTGRERVEYEALKNDRAFWLAQPRPPFHLSHPEWATEEEKSIPVERTLEAQAKYILDLEAALHEVQADKEEWQRRAFVSEESLGTLRDSLT